MIFGCVAPPPFTALFVCFCSFVVAVAALALVPICCLGRNSDEIDRPRKECDIQHIDQRPRHDIQRGGWGWRGCRVVWCGAMRCCVSVSCRVSLSPLLSLSSLLFFLFLCAKSQPKRTKANPTHTPCHATITITITRHAHTCTTHRQVRTHTQNRMLPARASRDLYAIDAHTDVTHCDLCGCHCAIGTVENQWRNQTNDHHRTTTYECRALITCTGVCFFLAIPFFLVILNSIRFHYG